MRTLILPIAVMLLLTSAQAADRKMPRKFLGNWCTTDGSTFKRGRCPDTDGWLTVTVNGTRGHETDVLNIAIVSSENYRVKFKCHGEGETWTTTSRMSLDNKGPLSLCVS